MESFQDQTAFLETLEKRFKAYPERHPDLDWALIHTKLIAYPNALESLYQMEISGGAPDVLHYDSESDKFLFFDCAEESPKHRRSLCYDQQALISRKKFPPSGNALDQAAAMGIRLLTEKEYRFLQTKGKFDQKTSSWIQTPEEIRKLGGALFCDRRYNQVFTYHNGADSYYAARGFRGVLEV